MSLSAQQERFCQLVVQGKNQTEAYAEAGYKGEGKQLGDNASRLIAKDRIRQRIAELQAAAAQEAQIDLAWLIREAADTYAAAKKDKAYGPAVSALKEVGILTGERVEKSQRENINRNVDEFDEAELYAIASAGSAGVAGQKDRKAQLN
jgi:phage terminase small subunit